MGLTLGPQELDGNRMRYEDGAGRIIRSSINNTGWRKTASGNYMIYDIPIGNACEDGYAAHLDVYISVNSNAGGSGFYRNMGHWKVFCETAWNGSSYSPYVGAPTKVASNSGSQALLTRVWLDGGSGTTQGEYQLFPSHAAQGSTSLFWNSSPVYLRLKFDGWNASYPDTSADRLMIVTCGRPYN